eukprot:gene26899-35594_t
MHNSNGHFSRAKACWGHYSPQYIVSLAYSSAGVPISARHCRLYGQALPSSYQAEQRKRLVFLGTPKVVADDCLRLLVDSSYPKSPNSSYEIVAVVTQPPAPAGRSKKIVNSPVHDLSNALNIPIYFPENAKDEQFLAELDSLKVDMCITAAYGNYLPKRFLSIPKFGTVNIHPSLLPKYRGAAPVQRCLENGDELTGSSEVLSVLFKLGTHELINVLPSIFDGSLQASQQVDSDATAAPKLSPNESYVDLNSMTAAQIHNKCRGFSDWPGIYSTFLLGKNATLPQKVKILTTTILDRSVVESFPKDDSSVAVSPLEVGRKKVVWVKSLGLLVVECAGGSYLGIRELQLASKNAMDAKAFINGLRGDLTFHWVPEVRDLLTDTRQ